MFYRIRRARVWLRRLRYSRGFGVQSPWAYRFIRYVVNEHYPYYDYSHLNHEVYGLNKFARKLCRLYFRLANYCQPTLVVDYGAGTMAYRSYFKAGCKSCDVLMFQANESGLEKLDNYLHDNPVIDIARISLKGDYRSVVDKLMNFTCRKSIFIIQRINKNNESQRYWEELRRDSRVGVTFDLYYCGIVFFDPKIYKQNYLVNF